MGLNGRELQELELIALGRVPRCAGCPRYAALLEAHGGSRRPDGGLPAVPLYCTHQICAPLAARFLAAADLPLAG